MLINVLCCEGLAYYLHAPAHGYAMQVKGLELNHTISFKIIANALNILDILKITDQKVKLTSVILCHGLTICMKVVVKQKWTTTTY